MTGHTLHLADNQTILPALPDASIDTIMTDPPYGTGRDREYPDTYTPAAWQAMIEAFLRHAHRLLKPSGVCFTAVAAATLGYAQRIGDAIFTPAHRIATLTWTDRGQAGGRFTRGGTDYILVWARDRTRARPWSEPLPGVDDFMDTVRAAYQATGSDAQAAAAARAWARTHPDCPWAKEYRHSLHGVPARHVPLTARGHAYTYHVTAPDGRRLCPPGGWRCPQTTFTRLAAAGLIAWSGRHPRRILTLDPTKGTPPAPVIYRDRRHATDHLASLIGPGRFASPKDHRELARWIDMSTPPDGTVLDPFAGSGSTGEAVMRLNAAHNLNLTSILIENTTGDVARDRLTAVAAHTGQTLTIHTPTPPTGRAPCRTCLTDRPWTDHDIHTAIRPLTTGIPDTLTDALTGHPHTDTHPIPDQTLRLLARLALTHHTRLTLHTIEHTHGQAAHEHGATWRDIALAYGMTTPTAASQHLANHPRDTPTPATGLTPLWHPHTLHTLTDTTTAPALHTAATALTAATTSPLHTAKPDACHHLALAVCAAAAAARMTEAAERLVGQARAAGCSWSRIARATGYRHDTSVRSVYDPVSRARRRRQSRAWRKRRDAPS